MTQRPGPRAAEPLTAGQRVRQLANLANGSTVLGLAVAGSAGTALSRGPRGLIIAANYRWRIPFAGAFVLGNVVVCRSDADALISSPALLGHEERHCSQYAWCLGLPFLPLYFLAAGWSQLRTGDPASGNFFERRAGLEAGGYTERNKRRRAAPDGGTMEVQA